MAVITSTPTRAHHATPHGTGPSTGSITHVGSPRLGRVGMLALIGPLLLFVQGIATWMVARGQTSTPSKTEAYAAGSLDLSTTVLLSVLTETLVVGGLGVLAWLTIEVGEYLGAALVDKAVAGLAAFGAAVSAIVAVGHIAGLLDESTPLVLALGGPPLVALALVLIVTRLVVTRGHPLGAALVTALGGILLALPLGLLPLAALLLLTGLAPLMRGEEMALAAG